MTEQEQEDYLGIHIMKWVHFGGISWATDPKNPRPDIEEFCPLTDWNHWRQVEDEIMLLKHTKLWIKYLDSWSCIDAYVVSDLPERVSALISAHQSLYGN